MSLPGGATADIIRVLIVVQPKVVSLYHFKRVSIIYFFLFDLCRAARMEQLVLNRNSKGKTNIGVQAGALPRE